MKKVLLLIITLIVAMTCGTLNVAYAETQNDGNTSVDYKQDFAYTFIQEFT